MDNWEYYDLVLPWPTPTNVPVGRIGGGNPNLTLEEALGNFWVEAHNYVWSEIRKRTDNGWETIAPVGPPAIQYETFTKTVSNLDFGLVFVGVLTLGLAIIFQALYGGLSRRETWINATGIKIPMRRRRQ